jgi:DNA-binding GntR family transcriptional regulator
MIQSKRISLKTLREQVYDYLRELLNRGELVPGSTVDLAELSERLGVSKTPLRFALFQLENEGFVTILPRRGCVVNMLTLPEIRGIYQIIGSLESAVVRAEFRKITPAVVDRLRRYNGLARAAILEDDFDRYYAFNLEFHEQYLELSPNERLKRTLKTLKHRLYDFPRKDRFVKEWELRSVGEHEEFVRLLSAGDARSAASYIRDVHWDFEVQRSYIEQYYGAPSTEPVLR